MPSKPTLQRKMLRTRKCKNIFRGSFRLNGIQSSRSFREEVLAYTDRQEAEAIWERSMKDIFTFIRHFVPMDYFDLDEASPQQVKVLIAVNMGKKNFIIRAPRKGGKTILVAIIVVWLCLKYSRYRVFVLSGSLEQAKWLYRYCRDIVTGSQKVVEQLAQEPTKVLTEFKSGSFIICAPASFKQVNAPTVDCIVMDEYVLIPPEIVVDAWPMIRASILPMRFILSTATEKVGLDGFLDIFDRADELGFEPFYWSDDQCKWLNKEDSKIAKEILSEEDYRIQYKGGVPLRKGSIFSRILVMKAFKKLKNVSSLKDWEPRGPIKVGVDWGFTHDTVFTAGWLSLDYVLHPFRTFVTNRTDDEELANIALSWDEEFYERFGQRVDEWLCDSAGAFQNGMMRKKGLWVRERVFGHGKRGKQWMVGIVNWYFEREKMKIPDADEFQLLKKQLKAYRRDRDGEPVKGFDHCVDSFLCLCSGWDPTLELEEKVTRPPIKSRFELQEEWKNPEWEAMRVRDDMWRPDSWRKTPKWPWE